MHGRLASGLILLFFLVLGAACFGTGPAAQDKHYLEGTSAFAGSSGGKRWRCADVSVDVAMGAGIRIDVICDAAQKSADALGTCGLRSTRTITLAVTDGVFLRSGGGKWGQYITSASHVEVLSEELHRKLGRFEFHGTDVPPDEHYAGIVAHEIAHAIFSEAIRDLELPATAHEYVAYVAQVLSYSLETRQRILAREPPLPTSSLFVFSNFLMVADPDRFGINAYAHFVRTENRCSFLADVLRNKVHFPSGSD